MKRTVAALVVLGMLVLGPMAGADPTESESAPMTHERLEVDWEQALQDAQTGVLTLPLSTGSETYLVSENGFAQDARYFEVDAGGNAVEVFPPRHYNFGGIMTGELGSHVRLTIGPNFFGGQVTTPERLLLLNTVGKDGSLLVVDATYADRDPLAECEFELCPSVDSIPEDIAPKWDLVPPEPEYSTTIILESTSAFWDHNGGEQTFVEMQNGLNTWSGAFGEYAVEVVVPVMFAWTSGGPSGKYCFGDNGLLDDQREVWKAERDQIVRDVVLLHHYFPGPLVEREGASGGAGGCAMAEGALHDSKELGYAVANMDDPTNKWHKMLHETGHLYKAGHTGTSDGYLTDTGPCGGEPHHSEIMKHDVAGGDACKQFRFSTTSGERVRDCVADQVNC